MKSKSEQRLDNLLVLNVAFAVVYILSEQLKLVFREQERVELEEGTNNLIEII